jgi:hypothetical protein
MADDALTNWAETLNRGVGALLRPTEFLRPPPPASNGDPVGRLQVLLTIRHQILGLDESVPDAFQQCAQKLAGRAAAHQLDIEDGVAQVLDAVRLEVEALLPGLDSAMIHQLGLIRTSDFQGRVFYLDTAPMNLMALEARGTAHKDGGLILGLVDSGLQPEHPLRHLEDTHYYRADMVQQPTERAIVLGYPTNVLVGRGRERAFYGLASALVMSRWLVRWQREQDRDRAEQLRREEEQSEREREAWENERVRKYPMTAIRSLKKQIADLEARQAKEPVTVAANGEAATTQVTEVVP